MNGQSQSRLDDFIGMLCESWKGIHRMVGESLLKSKKLRIASHTKSVRQKPKNDLKEEWDKKKNQPFQLQKNKGKFLQAPKFPYPCQLLKENNAQKNVKSSSTPNLANDTRFENTKISKNTESQTIPVTTRFIISDDEIHPQTVSQGVAKRFCPMPNRSQNCWFNALSQALVRTDMATRLLELPFHDLDVNVRRLLNIWYYMRIYSPSPVPSKMISDFLTSPSNAFVQSLPSVFGDGGQHDPHDFYAQFISRLIRKAKYMSTGMTERVCTVCGDIKKTNIPELFIELHLKNNKPNIQLLLEFFATQLGPNNFFCSKCKEATQVTLRTEATLLQKTILIAIKRSLGVKDTRPLEIKHFITFDKRYMQLGMQVYSLKAIVCHSGNSVNCGHYVTQVLSKHENNNFITRCDDLRITVGTLRDNHIPHNIEKTAYLLIYEQHDFFQNELVFGMPIMRLLALYEPIQNSTKNKVTFLTETSQIRREELVIKLAKSKSNQDFYTLAKYIKDAMLSESKDIADGPVFLENALNFLAEIDVNSSIF